MSATTSRASGAAFDPMKGLEFIASQFAVFGPVTFSVLLIVLVRVMKPEIGRADRLMLCFAVPTLLLVTATAFVTRANGNWAAPAFISANVLVAAVLVRHAAWRWIAVSIAIGVIAQIGLLIGDANARRISLPRAGQARRLCAHHGLALARRGDRQARAPGRRAHHRRRAARRRRVAAVLPARQRTGGAVVAVQRWSRTIISI